MLKMFVINCVMLAYLSYKHYSP